MKVLLLQTGEPMFDDDNYRPMRGMNLARFLASRGHEVTIYTSDFYHQKMTHRRGQTHKRTVDENITLHFFHSPGYKASIGVGRLADHLRLGLTMFWHLLRSDRTKYDVAFIGFPPIETAFFCSLVLRARRIPYLLDVKDLWPELFWAGRTGLKKQVIKLAAIPFRIMAATAKSGAACLVTMSDGFARRLAKETGNGKDVFIAPLTSEETAAASARDSGTSSDGPFIICFIGAHMSVYDFGPVADAARLCQQRGLDCRFVIAGDGDYRGDIAALFDGAANVDFPGWVDQQQSHELVSRSSLALVPYKNLTNYTLNTPNKVVSNLQAGLPVASNTTGDIQMLLDREECGFFFETGEDLYNQIADLANNAQKLQKMSQNARAAYEKLFDFQTSYNKLVDKLETYEQPGEQS